ncbi:MAG: amino acid transporter, partial [Bacteroidota bacterium]
VFVFRKRIPHAERPYKTLGYPFTSLLFIILSTLFVCYTMIEKPAESFAGLGFLALGVPVYYLWKNQTGKQQGISG